MNVGDIVKIHDGSYAAIYKEGKLIEQPGIAMQNNKYVVLLNQDGLPSFHYHLTRNVPQYTNDVLVQDVNDPSRLVFTRTAFLSLTNLTPNGTNGSKLAEALKTSRAIVTELFQMDGVPDLVLEMATILQRPACTDRDIAFARCVLKMDDRL